MLSDFFEAFKLQTATRTANAYGSVDVTYADGATVMMGLAVNSQANTQAADRDTDKVTVSLFHPLTQSFMINDRVKRVKDGTVYRVLTKSADMTTPAMASMQYGVVNAEVVR